MRLSNVFLIIAGLAAAVLIIESSVTPAGIDVCTALRLCVLAFGAGLALWNLIPGTDETLIERGSRSLRLRLLLFGIALALAAFFIPSSARCCAGGRHGLFSSMICFFPSLDRV
jgi:hypothetical protein